jgi:anti-anti-sigma regulatory factor
MQQRPYQFIAFERDGDVFCVRLLNVRIDDDQMEDLGAELARLIDEENCRKMVVSLGPEELECLMSMFLAKLLGLHRRLQDQGGLLALAHVSDYTRGIFRSVGIEKFFRFFPDRATAVQELSKA